MPDRRLTSHCTLNWLVIALHALAGLAAVAVLFYAVGDALTPVIELATGRPRATPDGAEGDDLSRLLDWLRWRALLTNSGIVGGVAVAVALGLGGPLALAAARTDLPGRRLFLGALLLGLCVPGYVSLAFMLAAVPLITFLNSPWAAGLLAGLLHLPLATLVCAVALRAVDRELEDHASLDATPRQVLLRITLPTAAWGWAAAAGLVFLLVSTDTTVPDLLAVRTFAEEVRSQYTLGGRRAGPLLTGLPLLIVLAGALAVCAVRWRRLGDTGAALTDTRPRIYRLGRWRWTVLAAVCLLAAGAAGPLAALVRRLGPAATLPEVLHDVLPDLANSVLAGMIAATLMLLPAAGLAWWLVRGGRGRIAGWGGLIALLATPAPVVGISLIALLNRPGLPGRVYDSPLPVLAAYFVRFLPVAVLLLVPGVQRVPRELEWTARADGCDWLRTHWHVRRPLLGRDLAVVWLVVFVLCTAEISTAVLVTPPQFPLASVRIFTLLHFGVYQDVAVLAAAAAVVILVPWGLLVALLRRFAWDEPPRPIRRSDAASG